MSAQPVPAPDKGVVEVTANDRLKKSWESWFWGSMIVAVAVHFTVFAFWPDMSVDDVAVSSDVLENIEIPPEVEIPPPPEAIQRPATPQIATTAIDEDITITPTTFEDNPVEDLPPPPDDTGAGEVSTGPTLTPYEVAPVPQNTRDVIRALEREYPPLLKDSGIGGTVIMWFYIDTEGRVQDTQIFQSSGYDAFDQAASRVAEVYRFSPAYNRDKKVPVWVQIPITFNVN